MDENQGLLYALYHAKSKSDCDKIKYNLNLERIFNNHFASRTRAYIAAANGAAADVPV